MEGRGGFVWALVSGFNCPLCQIGDNKQFEAPILSLCLCNLPERVGVWGVGVVYEATRQDLEAGCVCQGGKSLL